MTRILCGAPVHNREDLLPGYLASMVAQHSFDSEMDVGYAFVLNNCNDATVHILNTFKSKFDSVFPVNLIFAEGESFSRRTSDRYSALAEYRNMLLDEAVSGEWDYLFSVDTDIVVPLGTLKRLLNHKKDIVSACVYNDELKIREVIRCLPQHRRTNIMKFSDKANLKCANHVSVLPQELFRCDVAGAVYLVSNQVARACRYGWDPQGEDIAFCREAIKAGLEIWADGRLMCQHLME